MDRSPTRNHKNTVLFETKDKIEYRSAPKNNNSVSLLLQGKKQGILYQKKRSPPVGQTLGSAILMKRLCPGTRMKVKLLFLFFLWALEKKSQGKDLV